MKKILLTAILAAAALFAAACGQSTTEPPRTTTRTQRSQTPPQQGRVPAFMDAASATKLPQTLAPDRFMGPTRDAYRVVREIPETIAQLPCYCHCDMSFGHKSLHSCFEDLHASQCAVCVSEALEAYDLQKRGMSPAQIREQIVSEYSRQ